MLQPPSNQASIIAFWSDIAKQTVEWMHPWHKTFEGDLKKGHIKWFQGGQLNVSVNCIDRHLPHKANHPAIIWEGDDGSQKVLTFATLHAEVCRMSNLLKHLHIGKGDRVAIYLPMIPEAAIAMLACARIGAIHTVVFAGFSAQALKQRMMAAECACIITTQGFNRGGNYISLRDLAETACDGQNVTMLIVGDHDAITLDKKNQYSWEILKKDMSSNCAPEPMDAEDPFFILYTSGSTGTPKGLVHTTGGYLVQVAYTHQLIFNCQPNEIFWCTADVGWITGHSYTLYGPLCHGITTLMFEGIPTWPDPSRNWHIIDTHRVNVFYTAPTAIRTLMQAGESWLESSTRHSLRLLGSVGEPINPEAWLWYYHKVGKERCPIVDTWWQTETGAMMIAPRITENTRLKPGAAGQPIPGIIPVLLDDDGQECEGTAEGRLAIKYPWPSIARTIAGDHKRYCDTYLCNNYYITGDGARRDDDGDYWITGRMDDVVNISGHRLGTAEIESALQSHPMVSEAAVVGIPDTITGQAMYAFVVLKEGKEHHADIKKALMHHVKEEISAIAKPKTIQFVNELPKTRSGKIMRRILRKIAGKEITQLNELGDLSTLANPSSVEALL